MINSLFHKNKNKQKEQLKMSEEFKPLTPEDAGLRTVQDVEAMRAIISGEHGAAQGVLDTVQRAEVMQAQKEVTAPVHENSNRTSKGKNAKNALVGAAALGASFLVLEATSPNLPTPEEDNDKAVVVEDSRDNVTELPAPDAASPNPYSQPIEIKAPEAEPIKAPEVEVKTKEELFEEGLQRAKDTAEREMSEQGRIAASRILDYISSDASMSAPYQAGVQDGTNFNGFGNKAYNVAQGDNPDLWLPEAFIRVGEPNQIAINIVDGTGGEDWTLIGKVSQTVTMSEARSNELANKQLTGQPLTLEDFRAVVDDPESTFSTSAETSYEDEDRVWSEHVNDVDDIEGVEAVKDKFTRILIDSLNALDIE